MATSDVQEVTPEALIDLPVPHDVSISSDGSRVVYAVSPYAFCPVAPAGEAMKSSLWAADVGKENSARQITSGLFNDHLPQWCPGPTNKGCIAFISDRAKPGESHAIYILFLKGGEAYPVTETNNKKEVVFFKWNADGTCIGFLAADEKRHDQEARDKETGGAKVHGENWEFARLRCLHVATRTVETLSRADTHVTDFAWNDDGTEIAFVSQNTPDLNSAGQYGVNFQAIDLASKTTNRLGTRAFPGPVRNLVWLEKAVYFIAGVSPGKATTSSAIYKSSITTNTSATYMHGLKDCVASFHKTSHGILVHAEQGIYNTLYMLDTRSDTHGQVHQVLVTEAKELHSYDDVHLDGAAIGVYVTSDSSSPPEVFSNTVGRDDFGPNRPVNRPIRLSRHGSSLARRPFGHCEPIKCAANDGTECDAVLIRPSDYDKAAPIRTIVMVHGGPYSRITNAFNMLYFYWVPYLVSAGYTVLCPNYRGGCSHGDEYASKARGAMGTGDYQDIIDIIKFCISKGHIDEQRVAIGGYSQGGFLSYLATTRSDFDFKAAVCGAGISDWDMLCMSNDLPWAEKELAGLAPWETDANDTKARHGSPIWHIKNVKTPILILHPENDERVPVSQAVAFHRGCVHHGVPCEFVTYPREGHVIKEREHLIDMLKRIRRFYDMHLK